MVRATGLTSMMRQFNKAKDTMIRKLGLSSATQSMQGLRFGSHGRTQVTNRTVMGRYGRRAKTTEDFKESSMSEEKERDRNLIREGMIMEITERLESMFDL